ncbi:SCO2322 family protein [Streptomyces sp. NPDC059740]|uniref:SCO2322 family protein n=1 Tax=Streptomyces sp. NPDC059740 TaxID=3346926 RepID=UPI00364C6086
MPALVLLLAVAASLLGAGTAHASAYRYWSFWSGDHGKWTYATEGPATARPADGEVLGFRFAVGADLADAARPRGAADFDAVCAGTSAADGDKRVAVEVDYGTAGDAPPGGRPPARHQACARVAKDATAADALEKVTGSLRYDSAGLLCAVTGYPETGCAEQVQDGDGGQAEPSATASGKPSAAGGAASGGGPSAGLLGGVAVVVVLGAAALWQARRRRG